MGQERSRSSDTRDRDKSSNLDEEMERDTQIRRDTQVRGSLGIPPSGNPSGGGRREEGVPEFEDDSRDDRSSDRTSER
jgi:hypothetical protein